MYKKKVSPNRSQAWKDADSGKVYQENSTR